MEEEDEVLRILFGGSTVSTVSRVLRLLLGFRAGGGSGDGEGEAGGGGDFRFLGDEEEEGGGFFLAAAARAPDMRKSKAEGGGFDILRRGVSE
jgi:hypothetical protein